MNAIVYLLLTINIILTISVIMLLKKKSGNDGNDIKGDILFIEKSQTRLESVLKDEISKNRDETNTSENRSRQEMMRNLNAFSDTLTLNMSQISKMQKEQLESFSGRLSELINSNDMKSEALRNVVEKNLQQIMVSNEKKLNEMRETVDEKLQNTLEKRLGESFKIVSERLELVYKGLGEMKNLASGVGDLKRILSNVKTRGTWGEIQLGSLIDQILAPDQYKTNVITKKGSNERVEFAVVLQGQKDAPDGGVLLPIDAKFPQEDYQRLLEAQDNADTKAAQESTKQLEIRIKSEANDIKSKYIDPPYTTDFGIMFLPTEGLYAEVLRIPGLSDILMREYRVVITGPTTLAAILNSLQIGFRTLAIAKRSDEVWNLLGEIKTEFEKFVDILNKTQKKLQEASNTIETASRKSRTIQRKLRNIQMIPTQNSDLLSDDLDESDE